MFKCLDTMTNAPVVSLDDRGPDWHEELRQKSHADQLRCPTCREPVAFRAGARKRPHFAHKTLANCPTQNESPDLLAGRAVLYQWLRSKFGDGVTLEGRVDGSESPRAFDCWVDHLGKSFAYWIIEKRLTVDDRVAVETSAAHAKASLIWVCLAAVLRRLEQDDRFIMLSTTERACLRESEFDIVYEPMSEGTLHYLDAEAKAVTTFRACRCKHDPQVYEGHEVRTELEGLLVSPKTGGFVHPHEHDMLIAAQQRQAAEAERRREVEEAHRQVEQERLQRAEERRETLAALQTTMPRPFIDHSMLIAPSTSQPPARSNEREGACEDCGQVTSDWWMFNGKTGTCRCNKCRREREGCP